MQVVIQRSCLRLDEYIPLGREYVLPHKYYPNTACMQHQYGIALILLLKVSLLKEQHCGLGLEELLAQSKLMSL